MSYSQARAISRVATAEKEAVWVEYAKRMPASQLDTLCRSYEHVQAYDQARGTEAGAMAGAMTGADVAAQFAAQRTVTRRSRGRLRADAFMNMVQERMRGNRLQRTPIEIIITVPHAGLHGSAEPSDLATMAHGDIIAAATARRYCCDAGVVVASVDVQGVPLSVGRKTRTIPAAIKRALLLRDRTCRFPGCTHRRYVDEHHINHWAVGGETE